MEPKTNQTNMTQPPTGQTQMTQPPAEKKEEKSAQKKVKLRLLKDCRLGLDPKDEELVHKAGQIVEVPVALAKELIKPRQGTYAFRGETFVQAQRHSVKKAEVYSPVAEELAS